MKHECSIGLYNDYEESCLFTLDDLKNELKLIKESNKYRIENGFETLVCKEYELKDFADFRKNVFIDRFLYCPYCGKKIDWKEMCKEK